MEFLTTFGAPMVSGLICAVATIAVIKTDIGWLKESVRRAHERIDSVEHDCKSCKP